MREALALALVDFVGAIIVVAHDRHLLAAATDQWMLVADGALAPFDGDLDDYKRWAREHAARAGGLGLDEQSEVARKKRDAVDFPGDGKSTASPGSRRDERRAEAQLRQREADARKPFEKKLAAIEAELATLTREAQETEAWLSSTAAYADGERERLQEALKRRGELQGRIAQLEDDWLWMQAEMERAVETSRAMRP
jgi:ATP-binding cassette subfamily F protein 3